MTSKVVAEPKTQTEALALALRMAVDATADERCASQLMRSHRQRVEQALELAKWLAVGMSIEQVHTAYRVAATVGAL